MGIGFGGFEGILFSFVPVIITIGFIMILGFFIFITILGITKWNKNNHSPVLTVSAKVVAKRTDFSSHMHHHGTDTALHHTASSTTYYITFEVESGDRIELHVPDQEYGMLIEGDMGRLTFQGTRFKGFERLR